MMGRSFPLELLPIPPIEKDKERTKEREKPALRFPFQQIPTSRPPFRPRREKGTEAPEAPDGETPTAQQELGGEAESEVEVEVESTPEGMEE